MPAAPDHSAVASLPPMHPLVDVYKSRELLWNLTLRELRTKYRRSFLGWGWSMLNPLVTVAIYGFVFGTLFAATAPVGVPSGLTGFAYFLLCGLLPWNFFALVNNLGLGSISGNAGLAIGQGCGIRQRRSLGLRAPDFGQRLLLRLRRSDGPLGGR